MPKQVGLGVSLKASLSSREYTTLLNKFEEKVNYHEVLGIGAYWEEQIIERSDGYATISTNIVFGECAQAAFDNAYYGQENASQHVTNTVIYQYWRNGEFKVTLFSGLLHNLRWFWEMATCKEILVTPKRFGVSWVCKIYVILHKCSSLTI